MNMIQIYTQQYGALNGPFLYKELSQSMNKLLALAVFILTLSVGQLAQAQTCTVNAGGNQNVCASTTTLTGARNGDFLGDPSWSFISGPVTPSIVSPTSLTTSVTGMTEYGSYVFRLTQVCGSGTATSDITINARPLPPTFTAGPDISGICATVGSATLSGVIPPNYTGAWTFYNIAHRERFGTTVTTNGQLSSTTSATPTFSLVDAANHTIDPAYYAILTITSLDGFCTYSDTTKITFSPNITATRTIPNSSKCFSPSSPFAFWDFNNTGPSFFISPETPNAAGNTTTTISLNVTSQPAGANMTFQQLEGRRMLFNDALVPGTYNFSITYTNSCGTNTQSFSVTNQGVTPNFLIFSGYPDQKVVYGPGFSGGEVHCGIAGISTPELFHFDINPLDPPSTVTTVTSSGILPPGASTPTITVTGAGTMNRTASVNPGASGWQVGTYRFSVVRSSGSCSATQPYYIHISDGNRVAPEFSDVAVCQPTTNAVTATITLPTPFQTPTTNTSYFVTIQGVP